VTKESLMAGDARPLIAALMQIVSNSSFKQQVGGACVWCGCLRSADVVNPLIGM
jgi:hypothetical protein